MPRVPPATTCAAGLIFFLRSLREAGCKRGRNDAARGVIVAAGTDGAPRALRTIPPPPPVLPREVGILACIVAPAAACLA